MTAATECLLALATVIHDIPSVEGLWPAEDNMAVELICVARGRDGAWEAICLDLDIAVSGASFKEVRSTLAGAIESYIADAMREDEPTRTQLLRRRVPFFSRIRWTWPFIVSALFGRKKRDATETREFPLPCPA